MTLWPAIIQPYPQGSCMTNLLKCAEPLLCVSLCSRSEMHKEKEDQHTYLRRASTVQSSIIEMEHSNTAQCHTSMFHVVQWFPNPLPGRSSWQFLNLHPGDSDSASLRKSPEFAFLTNSQVNSQMGLWDPYIGFEGWLWRIQRNLAWLLFIVTVYSSSAFLAYSNWPLDACLFGFIPLRSVLAYAIFLLRTSCLGLPLSSQ